MTPLLAAALSPLAGLAAAATDGGGDGLGAYGPLINLGAIGLICALLIGFARGAYRREVERADRAEAEIRRQAAEHAAELRALNEGMRDKQVPVLAEAVRVLGDVAGLMRERR